MLFAHFSHLSARILPEDSPEAFMDSRRRYTGFPGRWMKTFFTAYFCGLLKAVVAADDVPEMPSFIRHKFSLVPPEGCVLHSLRSEFRLESSPQSLFH